MRQPTSGERELKTLFGIVLAAAAAAMWQRMSVKAEREKEKMYAAVPTAETWSVRNAAATSIWIYIRFAHTHNTISFAGFGIEWIHMNSSAARRFDVRLWLGVECRMKWIECWASIFECSAARCLSNLIWQNVNVVHRRNIWIFSRISRTEIGNKNLVRVIPKKATTAHIHSDQSNAVDTLKSSVYWQHWTLISLINVTQSEQSKSFDFGCERTENLHSRRPSRLRSLFNAMTMNMDKIAIKWMCDVSWVVFALHKTTHDRFSPLNGLAMVCSLKPERIQRAFLNKCHSCRVVRTTFTESDYWISTSEQTMSGSLQQKEKKKVDNVC